MDYCLANPDSTPSTPFLPDGKVTAIRPVAEAEIRGWEYLYHSLAMAEFGGVPVLIIDSDAILQGGAGHLNAPGFGSFEHFMMDFIPPERHGLIPQFGAFEGNIRIALMEAKSLGFIPPFIMHGNQAAMILAPCSGCTPERVLHYSAGLERCDSGPLLEEGYSWRYYALFHELAHVIGANEPQADHIAALFCRRAFPESPAPWIEADMRALEMVVSVTLLATGQAEEPDYIHQTLAEYGWNMVIANDLANAVLPAIVAGLSDGEILAHRTHSYDDDTKRLFRLGALIRDAGLDDNILSGRMDGVLYGARKLGRSIDKLTADSGIRQMAARFAAAAGRIHRGAEAYARASTRPDGQPESRQHGGKAEKPHSFTEPSM